MPGDDPHGTALRGRHAIALFEGIDDAVFVHDLDGRILDLNPAACRRLGYSRDELLRMKTTDIDDPQFAVGFEHRLRDQLLQGRLSCEGCHIARDGRRIPVDINSAVIQIDGKPAILAVMRDISARKAAEHRQAAQHAVTRVLAEADRIEDAAPEILWALSERLGWEASAFWLLDPAAGVLRGQCTWDNGSADAMALATVAGASRYARGQGAAGRVWEAGEPIWFADITRVETSPCAELAGRTGARQVFAFPIRSGGAVHGVVALFGRNLPEPDSDFAAQTVSLGSQIGQFLERRRAEDAQRQLQTVLLRSEKLASIGMLSAGVAHEINNPLAYVANNLVVLERDVNGLQTLLDLYESARPALAKVDPETARQAAELAEQIDLAYVRGNVGRILARTREGVDRITRIVQTLRGLARTDPPRMEETRLSDLIDSSLEMARGRMLQHGIVAEVDIAGLPPVRCVAMQIGQVLLNLLINAVQAIEAKPGVEPGRIVLTARQTEEEVCVEVADNGCGIAADQLPRIYDPFYTSKPVGEGTGLGLSITHNIVAGHGGRIEVESTLGVGSRFRVFLPLRADSTHKQPGEPG
jgi:two-component system NtrC family sensor kinase